MMKISTKCEVDMTVCCLVIAFLLLIHYVTLWHEPAFLTNATVIQFIPEN